MGTPVEPPDSNKTLTSSVDKIWSHMKANWVATVITALLALAGLTVSLTVDNGPSDNGHKTKTITLKFDKSSAPGVQTGTQTVPAPVVNQIQPNLEGQLKDETPAGISPEQAQAQQKAQDTIKAALPALPTAGATAGFPGCRTEFIPSYSSRHGVRPTVFTLHLTVSPNVPGWADVNSVVHLFSNPNNLASSNFVLDGEGHCAYIVPIEQKAWTQAGGNPFSISVEVIDTGRESIYLAPAGMKQLARIVKTVSARTGIPIRTGRVSGNCVPISSGIVQHKDWGVCGGGHVDITPFSVPSIVKYIEGTIHAKPAKSVAWVKHRQQVHAQYQKDCRTKAQRRSNAKECAGLRTRARTLDKLIARKR